MKVYDWTSPRKQHARPMFALISYRAIYGAILIAACGGAISGFIIGAFVR